MYNVERFLSEAQKRVDTKVESKEVKQAAEEFKKIEQKRKVEVEHFAPKLEVSRLQPAELKDKLNRLSSTQWKTLPASDFVNGVEIILGRTLSQDEIQHILSGWFQPKVMDSLASISANCWNMTEWIAASWKDELSATLKR
jgi:hypothetical protein